MLTGPGIFEKDFFFFFVNHYNKSLTDCQKGLSTFEIRKLIQALSAINRRNNKILSQML